MSDVLKRFWVEMPSFFKKFWGWMFGLLAFAALVGLMASASGCAHRAGIDVVNHQMPVSDLYSRIDHDLRVMAGLPPAQRAQYLRAHWPNLEAGVVHYLRERGKLRPDQAVDRVEFRFGSLDGVRAEGGDGQTREGYFRDQIIALAYPHGAQKPLAVIVKCLNGLMALATDLDGLQPIGSYTPIERFTIGPREGLTTYVDYPTAVDLAERFNLPLYRGKSQRDRYRIRPMEARRLETQTDWVQVTVGVVEGDAFDLQANRFTPSPRRRGRS